MPFFRKHARIIIIAVAVMLVLMMLYYIGALFPLERIINVTLEPIQTKIYSQTDSVSGLYKADSVTIDEENTILKRDLAEAIKKNNDYAIQIEQYQEYDNQLAFAQENEFDTIPAEIISRVGQGLSSQVATINQGSHDGISVGLPIVYNDGILIGIVYNVEDSFSEIALITGNLVSVQGMIQNETKTAGLITGEFGTGLVMEYILKDNFIEPGNIVTTSGQDQYIPTGLIIGTVDSVTNEASELFKSATLRPILPYSNSSIVSVVVPN